MKYIIIITLFVCVLLISCSQKKEQGFSILTSDKFVIVVTCLNSKTVNVQTFPANGKMPQSMVVDNNQHSFKDFNVKSTSGYITLTTSDLVVKYTTSKGLSFTDAKTGELLLAEKENDFKEHIVLSDTAYNVSQTFTLSSKEAIYGLGQFQHGIFNYRGHSENLVQANREIANPVLLSTNNYLLYWDNYSKTTFNDDENGATLWSEVGDGINYYFVYGDNMGDAIKGFRAISGEVPMLPKSAFGFWMSKERYKSFDELLSVVEEFRKRKIPLDNIVQDWQYWGVDRDLWNGMEFNPDKFDNPKEVIDKLHNEYNVKLTLSVWPGVGKKTKIYREMDSIGALFNVPTWAGYKVVDIYNPKAQDIYWNNLYEGLYTKGVDSWWMDATEPSFRDGLYQNKQEEWSKSAGMTYIGTFDRYLNTYSLVLSKVMYENLRKQSNKRVSVLTRSAFAGQQKYSTSTWSGDIYASWNVLKKQITAGLNFCMTGIPYWTTDIGGFRVISEEGSNQGKGEISDYNGVKSVSDGGYKQGLKDSAYLELYTRWFQYAVFNPMFRAHGTEVPREIWQFGEPGTQYYDAQIEMINLRYSLLSYIYSNSWKVTSEGATMMRALAMDFTNDENTYNDASSFMFGDALLVHPVTKPMFYDKLFKIEHTDTTMLVYLPKHSGKLWYDFNSDATYKAGENITYKAPLNIIPVFVKSGSIIPRNKPVEHVNADDNKEMDIFIYSGADAKFTLYEDDNETYDYEKGIYSAVEITWNEQDKKVSISNSKGKQKMIKDRVFNFIIVSPDNKYIKQVIYNSAMDFSVE